MAEGTSLDGPITAVTVFRDGARVQRTGTVNVEPRLRPVVIAGLPASLDPASVRVAARGAGLALLDVEVHRRYRTDPLREETTRLRSEVERCRDLVQELDDEDTAEQARLSFLGHLSESAATALARAVSFGRADHDDLARMAGHLSADTGGALSRRREIGVRKRAARRELEAAEQRLAAAEGRAGGAVPVTEVSVTVEASAATTAEIDIPAVVKSRFFVDYRSSTITEGGDYLRALRAGAITPEHILGEIGEVANGSKMGRTSPRDVTLYKSLGIAPQDLASAHYVLQKARERGMGQVIDF